MCRQEESIIDTAEEVVLRKENVNNLKANGLIIMLNADPKTISSRLTKKQDEKIKELSHKAPLHHVILNMVAKHSPNPRDAAAYRVPKLWHGDLESDVGKALLSCDPNGPIVFVATKIVMDKHAGEVVAGRLFSGTVHIGDEVVLNMAKKDVRLQQVSVYKGAQRVSLDAIPSGNIIGLVGLKGVLLNQTKK